MKIIYQVDHFDSLEKFYESDPSNGPRASWTGATEAEFKAINAFVEYSQKSEIIDSEKSFIIPSCIIGERGNSGGKRSELDAFIYIHFNQKAHKLHETLNNFIILLEIKSHRVGAVTFTDDEIIVKYPNSVSKVIKKMRTEASTTFNHLSNSILTENRCRIFSKSLAYFPNISSSDILINDDLPIHKYLMLSDNMNDESIIKKCQSQIVANFQHSCVSTLFYSNQEKKQIPNSVIHNLKMGLISKTIKATPKDRRVLDLLHDSNMKIKNRIEKLFDEGERNIIIRGPSGTGKTLALLKIAIEKRQRNLKVIVLTFNAVLKADLNRITDLYLQNINALEDRGILQVESVNHYVRQLYDKLFGENDAEVKGSPAERLKFRIDALQEYVKNFGKEDVRKVINFHWDYILIDEGQDMSCDFISFIKSVRSKRSSLIGVVSNDQIINSFSEDGETFEDVLDDFEPIDCDINYRNYSGIREFSYKCFKYLKSDFIKKSESEVPLILGEINDLGSISFLPDSQIHEKDFIYGLTTEIRSFNCSNNDILVIEPSNSFLKDNGKPLFFDSLHDVNIESLDFKKITVKRDREEQIKVQEDIRIVHYKSARGLESWIVIVRLVDMFYNEEIEGSQNKNKLYKTLVSIACSRAIKKLVITYDRENDQHIEQLKMFRDQVLKKGKIAA